MTDLTPEYLRIPLPPLHCHLHGNSETKALKTILGTTDRYLNSFYPNTVTLWNDLSPDVRLAKSISVLKKKRFRNISTGEKEHFQYPLSKMY